MSLVERIMNNPLLSRVFWKAVLPFISLKSLKLLVNAKVHSLQSFEFNGANLPYFFHSYNNFRLTCRCVEIPIIKHYLEQCSHDNVLEIGNVTKHYYGEFLDFKDKDTVDKYERAYDVINKDIADYQSDREYDFIFSISTFEHMDSDAGNNPDFTPIASNRYSSHAFANISRVVDELLADGGQFVLTFPLGQGNREIDRSLYGKEYEKFTASSVKIYFMRQLDELTWEQTSEHVEDLAVKRPICSPQHHRVYVAIMDITK